MSATVYVGDCLRSLSVLPDNSVHCCVTSPPYFGLRDYGTAKWKGGDANCDHRHETKHQGQGATSARAGRSNVEAQKNENFRAVCGKCGAIRIDPQIGLEQTPEEYVAKLVAVFREVRRVLRDDGTLWLNLGDSYTSGGRTWRDPDGKDSKSGRTMNTRPATPEGLKEKDLIGIPWMVAFALRADGWYLRQDIIWAKPNPMPESVTDRCTKAHEYLFLLSKSPKYFFDHAAIKEPSVTKDPRRPYTSKGAKDLDGRAEWKSGQPRDGADFSLRNRRDVWNITTKPFKGSHFAVFPPDLIEPCILAGSPKQVCGLCGAPHIPITGRVCEKCSAFVPTQAKACPDCGHVRDWKDNRFDPDSTDGAALVATDFSTPGKNTPRKMGSMGQSNTRTVGYAPSCTCNHLAVPATVLDPFGGSGTTAGVAAKHGRNSILCELNAEYAALVRGRISSITDNPTPLTIYISNGP